MGCHGLLRLLVPAGAFPVRPLHSVVVNPSSGRGRGGQLARHLPDLFRRLNLAAEFHLSRTEHHFRELVRTVARQAQRVVICGGDGSVNMALSSCLPGECPPLALLPCGRGNDVARSLGIPRRPDRAAALLLKGREGRVDVGLVDQRPFASIAAMGFDSLVSLAAARMKRLKGGLVYLLAAVKELARFQPPQFSVSSEGFTFRGRAMMVSVANAPYYGGGMKLSPASVMNDGLLEVCVVLPTSKASFLRLLPLVFTGKHVSSPLFLTAQVRSVRVCSDPPVPVCADGEHLSFLPATIRVAPGACRMVLPTPP